MIIKNFVWSYQNAFYHMYLVDTIKTSFLVQESHNNYDIISIIITIFVDVFTFFAIFLD